MWHSFLYAIEKWIKYIVDRYFGISIVQIVV